MSSETDFDPKRVAILEAAFSAFCQYGFRRTSMEDIAKGVGVSRAALYLHYKNKQDILRSLTHYYFERALRAIEAELTPGRVVQDALSGLMDQIGGPLIEDIVASPHGRELLEAKYSASGDIVTAETERVNGAVADWLASEAAAGRISLDAVGGDAHAVADLIYNSWVGIKEGAATREAYRTGAQNLVNLMARALRP